MTLPGMGWIDPVKYAWVALNKAPFPSVLKFNSAWWHQRGAPKSSGVSTTYGYNGNYS